MSPYLCGLEVCFIVFTVQNLRNSVCRQNLLDTVVNHFHKVSRTALTRMFKNATISETKKKRKKRKKNQIKPRATHLSDPIAARLAVLRLGGDFLENRLQLSQERESMATKRICNESTYT
jgi:hypothetical protein